MTADQVESIMGPPLRRGDWARMIGVPEGDYWDYTRPTKSQGNYWKRSVFFKNGRVELIDTEFYVD